MNSSILGFPKAVARQCGLSDRQLRRYPEYLAFRANAAAEQWHYAGERRTRMAAWRRGRKRKTSECPPQKNWQGGIISPAGICVSCGRVWMSVLK